MDIKQKYTGYTHIALKIDFLFSLKAFLAEKVLRLQAILALRIWTPYSFAIHIETWLSSTNI